MKIKRLFFFLLLLNLASFSVGAQGIQGKITDSNNTPIDAVAVILQTTDSLFVEAGITNEDGTFLLQATTGNYILYLQHILYEPLRIPISSDNIGVVSMKEKENILNDITVTAERPQVKVEGGTLIYDTPQLIQNKPVTNAFEAIRELPGVISTDESLGLLGASGLNIVINGQLTTMTLPQLIAMLKTIPASRVKSTEVMYNAPARYNVKGALINVVLDQADATGETLQGEVGAGYRQQYYAHGNAHGNLLYAANGFSLDILANGSKGRAHSHENMFARHSLENEKVEINQYNRSDSYYNKGSFRLGMEYVFKNEDKLSANYFIDVVDSDSKRSSSTTFNYLGQDILIPAESFTTREGNDRLQNAQIQYNGHQGITAGIDYTNFHSPDNQHYLNQESDGTDDMLNNNKQNIHKWMVFANHSYTIKERWKLNYGVNANLARSNSQVEYLWKENGVYIPDRDANLDDIQKEWSGNVFVDIARSFGKFSANISLKAEYFRSDYDSNGTKTTLWDEWTFFPNASLSYVFNPAHVLQFTLSSDKRYPAYWSVNPQTSYINSYTVITGNPSLKPSRSYEGQLMFILKQKYIFLTFMDYKPDYFTQMPYQSNEELRNTFRFENLDYQLMYGVAIITPFRLGEVVNSRLTLHGVHMREKSSNFHDFTFDNTRVFGRVSLNNTINLSSKPDVKLTIDGYYVSPAQQGVFKLGYSYDVSTGLKWTFADGKGALTVKYENIFRSHLPSYMKVDVGNQYSNMKLYDDSAYLGIAFNWKFGGYKEKSRSTVDRSRFGK